MFVRDDNNFGAKLGSIGTSLFGLHIDGFSVLLVAFDSNNGKSKYMRGSVSQEGLLGSPDKLNVLRVL